MMFIICVPPFLLYPITGVLSIRKSEHRRKEAASKHPLLSAESRHCAAIYRKSPPKGGLNRMIASICKRFVESDGFERVGTVNLFTELQL